MSEGSTAPAQSVDDYVRRICEAEPTKALDIAIAESNRLRAAATKVSEEYRAMAEVEFDDKGKIVKATMAGLWRLATSFAAAETTPEQYRGKPNDCFIALQMSLLLGCHPLAYMQNSYVVHGKPGIEAKFATALLNTSGLIKGRIKYKLEGTPGKDDRRCTATAIDAETGDEVSASLDWKMVKAEGWLGKKGSKWVTMPDIMFHYRAAMFLIRLYYSEVLMGMKSVDELQGIGPSKTTDKAEADPGKDTLDDLADRLETAEETSTAEEQSADETPAEPVTQEEAEQADRELFDKSESAVEAGG